MAASHTLPHSSAIGKSGALVLSGYGIRVQMQAGHLLLHDGIADERRIIRLPRVNHGLKRLICISEDGFVTLSALKWLDAQNVSFLMLDRTGKIQFLTGPTAPSDARLRRAQALAPQSGAALEIARKLIEVKLSGQEALVRDSLKDSTSADLIAQFRERLSAVESAGAIRTLEAHAGGVYWGAWRDVPVLFPKSDQGKIPAHWKTFGTRSSPLTGSPRLAVNPPGAILNYCYALLESEGRLAVAAVGLDPGLGVLHSDVSNRDSLVFDIIETARPGLDSWLLNWLQKEPLRRSDFLEERNGNCRLIGAFAAKLSETTADWRKLVAPWAEWVAQTLWNSIRKRIRDDHTLPTRLTQRLRSEGRGNEFTVEIASPPYPKKVCLGCGATTRGGRHCPSCGREVSRAELIECAKIGRTVARGLNSRQKLSETQRRHRAAQRAWRPSSMPVWLNEDVYLGTIQPKLAAFTICTLASRLGVSEPYAADIRAGRRRPHPRHWRTLAGLVGVTEEGEGRRRALKEFGLSVDFAEKSGATVEK
jgi:CRISPR-associated endonuclease Cas1